MSLTPFLPMLVLVAAIIVSFEAGRRHERREHERRAAVEAQRALFRQYKAELRQERRDDRKLIWL